MKRDIEEATRGSVRNGCPQVYIYGVITAGSAQCSSELFKGVLRVRPPVRTAQRTTTLMMSLCSLVKHAFHSDKLSEQARKRNNV